MTPSHKLVQQILIIGIPPHEITRNTQNKYLPNVLFAFPTHQDKTLQTEVTSLLI